MAKKRDIRDIIEDSIKSATGSKRKQLPKKAVGPSAKKRTPRAEFPNPMVEGQKRYPAYNVQPIRPRKGAKSPEGNQDERDLRDRNEMPKRRLKPRPKSGIPTMPMPKRKPKAAGPRKGNY